MQQNDAGGAAKRTVNRPHRQPMQTVLEKILESKRQEVAERQKSAPVEQLREKISELGRPRNFFRAAESDRRSEEGVAERGGDSGGF